MGMRAVGSPRLSGIRAAHMNCGMGILMALGAALHTSVRRPHGMPLWRTNLALAGKLWHDSGADAERVKRRKSDAGMDPYTHEFDAFFRRHEQPLYGYLRRLLPTDEVAAEIAQEAFFRAWGHFETVRAYERPEAWLYRVATNLAISHLRRRQPLSFSHVFAWSGAGTEGDEPADDEVLSDPLDLEGQTVERDAIARALRGLPERQRAALLLRAVQGFSCEEVAETLGVTVPNARQILSRGRERFRRLYDASRHASDTPGEMQR